MPCAEAPWPDSGGSRSPERWVGSAHVSTRLPPSSNASTRRDRRRTVRLSLQIHSEERGLPEPSHPHWNSGPFGDFRPRA